ncbi:MAG: site-specific DNA-methyltransferase [Verrucomicrobia bacterium]|nr:MAG: site-specific DNA-methyltransferase [Verrucomicrobiota bacterium]
MEAKQLPLIPESHFMHGDSLSFAEELRTFREFQKDTRSERFPDPEMDLPVFINEFWTSKQRAASSLHEISYRACFKPQLPRFFISRLTNHNDIVYDPFMGRGTTPLEAGLMGRRPAGCDINPLSRLLLSPRFNPPTELEVRDRLSSLPTTSFDYATHEYLEAFYHPKTLERIIALRSYLLDRDASGSIDHIDAWIRMVATNRLTGHSAGFFSVYTLPPNQAVSVEAQRKINKKRGQTPPERDINAIIQKKTRTLLNKIDLSALRRLRNVASDAILITGSCDHTPEIESDSIALVVTSPPFLDVVDYQKDNWLRCWFNGLNAADISIWQLKKVEDWMASMTRVFTELRRILIPGGHVAFEVGEIRGGKILMETLVVPAAQQAGLIPKLILINDQVFTKTANCWGVSNSTKGTNTNRIILLQKKV